MTITNNHLVNNIYSFLVPFQHYLCVLLENSLKILYFVYIRVLTAVLLLLCSLWTSWHNLGLLLSPFFLRCHTFFVYLISYQISDLIQLMILSPSSAIWPHAFTLQLSSSPISPAHQFRLSAPSSHSPPQGIYQYQYQYPFVATWHVLLPVLHLLFFCFLRWRTALPVLYELCRGRPRSINRWSEDQRKIAQ